MSRDRTWVRVIDFGWEVTDSPELMGVWVVDSEGEPLHLVEAMMKARHEWDDEPDMEYEVYDYALADRLTYEAGDVVITHDDKEIAGAAAEAYLERRKALAMAGPCENMRV